MVLPVDDLIYTESHAWPDFSCYGWRLDCCDDLVLELSDYFINEEDSCPCSEHAGWDVVESKCGGAILSYFDVVSFTVDSLDLQVFR